MRSVYSLIKSTKATLGTRWTKNTNEMKALVNLDTDHRFGFDLRFAKFTKSWNIDIIAAEKEIRK